MFFSVCVSVITLSSNWTMTAPKSSSIAAPQWMRAQLRRLVTTRWMAPRSTFSCLRTLRISAELSAVTSVAVFMPPLLSSAKYCWPKPHSSPSSARATSNALRSGSMRMLGL